MDQNRDLILSADDGHFDPDLKVIDSTQALEPGYYWTCTKDVKNHADSGETLLLIDTILFEDNLHSVELLMHPSHGSKRKFKMLVSDFLGSFEPCRDAQAIREREKQAVMDRITELQGELMRTQVTPALMYEAIKPIVESSLATLRRDAGHNASGEAKKQDTKTRSLAKTHRRAARRSEAAGNPLVVPQLVVSSSVDGLIGAKINESGVSRLQDMAVEQLEVAKAQASWLTSKTKQISEVITSLTPYIEEQAAVAIARSSQAIKLADQIRSGICSLNLYTGTGVEVYDVRLGKGAPTNEPLSLLQAKRFMNEELAAWADVDAEFDYTDQQRFFDELGTNAQLLEQVLPHPRCVVTMAVRRDERYYSDPWQALQAALENQRVFLLIRNGENVHVVYSADASHEAAGRLFPTNDEMGAHFQGADGQRISIRDIEFGKASQQFDNAALLYRRFLILLCGLDHRLRLMGDFYPIERQMEFMSLPFQQSYFRFVADDEHSLLLGDALPPVADWLKERNALLQTGSRVFILRHYAGSHSVELKRRRSLTATERQFRRPFIAQREGKQHYVTLETSSSAFRENAPNVKCVLADETDPDKDATPWFVCVDGVDLETVRRYRHSRINRSMGVEYLKLIRRLENYLEAEAEDEGEARTYLLENAVEHGGMEPAAAKATLNAAIRNWRAARRGIDLPRMEDMARLNEVLTLMIPKGEMPPAMEGMLEVYLAGLDGAPLALTRSGKNRYVLYVTATDADKATYPDVLDWRWVRRVILDAGKTKLKEGSTSLVWLLKTLPAAETEIRRWIGFEEALNKEPEPIALRKYKQVLPLLKETERWAETLKGGPGVGLPDDLFEILKARYSRAESDGDSYPVVALPMAAYSEDGRNMVMSFMRAHLDSVIKTYASDQQRFVMETRARERSRSSVQRWSNIKPTHWVLIVSEPELSESAANIFNQIGSSWKNTAAWAGETVQEQSKLQPHLRSRGYKNQYLTRTESTWSLDRSFSELAGDGPKLEALYWHKSWDELRWNHLSGREGTMRDARRKVHAKRYVHPYRVVFSQLARSTPKARSVANSYFVAPLLAHTPSAPRRKQ